MKTTLPSWMTGADDLPLLFVREVDRRRPSAADRPSRRPHGSAPCCSSAAVSPGRPFRGRGRPRQAVRQQVDAEDGAGVGRADEDAFAVGEVGGLDAAGDVLLHLVAGRGQRLRPDDRRPRIGSGGSRQTSRSSCCFSVRT